MTCAVLVHVDGIVFSLQQQGGISTVFRQLLSRLGRSGIDTVLSLELPLRQPCRSGDFGAVRVIERSARLAAERYRDCREVVPARRDTVFHSSYYRLPPRSASASVVTVHDFAYERCVGGARALVHRLQKNAAIRRAQAIICVSQATCDDLFEWVGVRPGQQVHVIPNGVSDAFAVLPPDPAASRVPPMALYVGERGRYKNFALALAALARLPEFELHCVGGGAMRASELAGVDVRTRARVRHLGAVGQSELNTLYNRATCLIYPSSYEGFGIPVLEAMRAGCPVVSLTCKAVLEVGGSALTVAEPEGESIARAVTLTAEPGHRQRIREAGLVRAAGFSWDRNYEQTVQLYRSLTT